DLLAVGERGVQLERLFAGHAKDVADALVLQAFHEKLGGVHFAARGWRQRKPGKRAKSRSVVIHSLPDSIARAAKKASGTKLPFAPAFWQSPVKISQCRGPAAT